MKHNIFQVFSLNAFIFLILSLPILSVDVPRIASFIPVLCLLVSFALPDVRQNFFQILMQRRKSLLFLVAFIGFLIGHSFFVSVSPDTDERLIKLVPILLFGFLFLISCFIINIRDFKLSKWLMVTSAVAASAIIFEIVLNAPIYKFLRGMEFAAPHNTAVFNRGATAVVLFFCLGFLVNKHKKSLFTSICALPVLAMLFFIQSQTAQLCFVLIFILFFTFSIRSKFVPYGLFTLFGLYALTFPFVVPYIFESGLELNQIDFFRHSFADHRLTIWDFVSRQIQTNHFWGFGLEFTRNFQGFEPRGDLFYGRTVMHPHNFILQVWIELGVVGILFLIVFVGALVRFIQTKVIHKALAYAFLFVFLALNSFSYGLWQGWWVGLMLVIAGIIFLYENKSNDQSI